MILDNFTFILLILYTSGVAAIITGGFVIALKRTRTLPSSSSSAGIRVIEPKIMSRDIKVSRDTKAELRRVKRLIWREGESPYEEC